MKGRSANGTGTFYADDTLRGKPIRVSVHLVSHDANGRPLEQALWPDAGKPGRQIGPFDFERVP